MKYIEKSIEDNQTGAMATCHVITGLNVDYLNTAVGITLSSYVSQKARLDKKNPLSFTTITLYEVPDNSVSLYDWAINQLIKPQPEDFVAESYPGYINPHLLALGEVKEDE